MARPAQPKGLRQMPLDNDFTPKKDGLGSRAMAAGPRDVSRRGKKASLEELLNELSEVEDCNTPQHGNTGGSSRQSTDSNEEKQNEKGDPKFVVPQTTPPTKVGRKSRKKETTDDMSQFLDLWFFDWLSLTIPNGTNGKGCRSEGLRGERENEEASKRLFTWATLQGLHVMRIGKGTDKYLGAAHMAFSPTEKDRVASIRDGHSKNLPNIELTGADGMCAELAPLALLELGPTLIARVDVSWDVSQEGLFDLVFDLLCQMGIRHKMDQPRIEGTEDRGRTLYFGSGEASVKVYEKSFEQLAKGKIEEADLDENLVRVEFTFRPKKGKKAGLSKIANEQGAGALLKTTRWVRSLTQSLAVMTKQVREDQAELSVGRVTRTPDVQRPQEMAKAAIQQYSRSLCNGAISQIVEEDFDGDWRNAKIDPEAAINRICDMVRSEVEHRAYDMCDQHGVLGVLALEEEADRQKDLLDIWMEEQRRRTNKAMRQIAIAAHEAREACGVPEPAEPF